MFKKLIALLCATVVTCSLVACGNASESKSSDSSASVKESTETPSSVEKKEEAKEPVEIVYWYRNGAGIQEYTQEVEDLLNEMLKELEGYEHITIRLSPHKDYATDFSLAQVSGDQIDLVSLPSLNIGTEIANGSFLPIDDLLAANPEITADLPDWFVELGKYNGVQYFVPNYQQCSNQYFFHAPKEFIEASDYTIEQVQEILYRKDIDEMAEMYENIVLSVRESTGVDTKYIYPNALGEPSNWVHDSNCVYKVASNFATFYWDMENECVAFTGSNENFKKAYLKHGEWYENGLFHPGSGIETNLFGGMSAELSTICTLTGGIGTTEMFNKTKNSDISNIERNGEIVSARLMPDHFIGDTNAAGGVAISSTCEHPEDAAKVIALLFNSKYEEFYNTLAYGLEGIHYEKISDGEIRTLEFDGSQGTASCTHTYWKWVGGNTFNAWRNQSLSQEQEDFILYEINEGENSIKSPLIGITWDTKPIENELAQITSVAGEYKIALQNGHKGSDTEAYYNEFMDKLEKAGLSKVLDEFNAQAKAFLESK